MATKKKKIVKKKAAAKKKAPAKKAATRPSVVHWEVQARDPERQQEFFGSLFGWKIDTNNPMRYGLVPSGGRSAINGGIGSTDGDPRVTVYVHVASINETLARAETLGAQTVLPRTDMGMVVMGQFRDPEGNIIGVIEG